MTSFSVLGGADDLIQCVEWSTEKHCQVWGLGGGGHVTDDPQKPGGSNTRGDPELGDILGDHMGFEP